MHSITIALAGLLLVAPLGAQGNAVAGADLRLASVDGLAQVGHVGPVGAGTTALAFATTACNVGSTEIHWFSTQSASPMADDHPLIAFLLMREAGGRFEQVSGYTPVKHGSYALMEDACGECQGVSGGLVLGVGCSDTYTVVTNATNYWLAPAEEIDPWTGEWEPVGSMFDRGMPAVAPPHDTDGLRSFTEGQAISLGPVGQRMAVADIDLSVPGAKYFYQGYYVVRGEVERNRNDNAFSRQVVFHPSGSGFTAADLGRGETGSVLHQWEGAQIGSAANGEHDGRLIVAVKVTGPEAGLYHYEYAVHNRDNQRKARSLRVPACRGARVINAGMSDVDGDPSNYWQLEKGAEELVWSTSENPLRWNSVYNFWFDSDAAPELGPVALDAFDEGAGRDSLVVEGLSAPTGLYNASLGASCGDRGSPSAHVLDRAPRATLGNEQFGVRVTGVAPLYPVAVFAGAQVGSSPFESHCTLFVGGAPRVFSYVARADVLDVPLPIPVHAALEGTELIIQAAVSSPGPGPRPLALTNALRIRVGDKVAGCR